MFENTLKVETFPNIELAYNYQIYLADALSGFLITGKATSDCAKNLLNNIVATFKMRKNYLYEEGISLIGAIFHFIKLLPSFVLEYLLILHILHVPSEHKYNFLIALHSVG